MRHVFASKPHFDAPAFIAELQLSFEHGSALTRLHAAITLMGLFEQAPAGLILDLLSRSVTGRIERGCLVVDWDGLQSDYGALLQAHGIKATPVIDA